MIVTIGEILIKISSNFFSLFLHRLLKFLTTGFAMEAKLQPAFLDCFETILAKENANVKELNVEITILKNRVALQICYAIIFWPRLVS